jgi:hypothetical protein
MAKMNKEQIERIVAEELPGRRLAQTSASTDARRNQAAPEASTPEIDTLIRKFGLTPDSALPNSRRALDQETSNGDTVDDEIALVERTDSADPLSRANRPKAKVLSPSGKVIGSQG